MIFNKATNASKFFDRLVALGFSIRLSPDCSRLAIRPSERLTDAQKASIREHRSALLDLLRLENAMEALPERAAIAEFEAGVPRPQAEALAIKHVVIRYRLNEFYGSPPAQGGGVWIGSEGQSMDASLGDLLDLYGKRLAFWETAAPQ